MLTRIGVATLALAGALLLLPGPPVFFTVPIAFAVYLLVLHLLGAWDEKERQMLSGVLGMLSRRRVAGSEA
jgi:hypothetical protein